MNMAIFLHGFRFLPRKNGKKIRNFNCNFREWRTSQQFSTVQRIVLAIEACTDYEYLKQLHASIFVYGIGSNIFLGTKLLNSYANFGCLTESRRVFDIIINRNLSLWNSIVVGYFRTGYFNEVLELYCSLKKKGIALDSSTLTFCFKSCLEMESLDFGRGVHADVFKFNLDGDKFVGSSLIGVYSKCGSIEDAHQVFDEMSQRDVVTYTAMITGYAHSFGQIAYEAFRIAYYMQKENLIPNRVTLVSLLQAAAQLKVLDEGKSIHCYVIRREIDRGDEVIQTSLLDMYIKCGSLNSAGALFSRADTKIVASWNVMIMGYVQCGQPSKALNLFYLMKQENHEPDMITLSNTLLGCADSRCLLQGMSIHGYVIRRDTHLDLVATTALIDMYSKCNRVNKAKELFDRMKIKDVVSCNVMMAGYLQSGLTDKAFEIFTELVEMGVKPNAATIINLLMASSDSIDVQKGKSIHGYIVKQEVESNVEVSNQILHMYMKCGRIGSARMIFEMITNRDLVSWTSMIMGYAHNGYADEALALFMLMREAGEEPDLITLISLLLACSQLGSIQQAKEIHSYVYRNCLERDVSVINSLAMTYAKCGGLKFAKFLFENMVERGLATWNTMIGVCGMHGSGKEALELFYRMQEENIEPDELTFTSILSACSHAGLVEEGQRIFHDMTHKHLVSPCEEHYSCMVDLLGRAGHLEEAYEFVKCLPSKQSASALGALLGACRVHRNTKLGEVVGRKLIDLEPENASVYILISNIYADAGEWSEVERIRAMARERGLRKMLGYSLIELDKQVCGV